MRISLAEIRDIECFLNKSMPAGELLLFRVQLAFSPRLRQLVAIQRKLYACVQVYGREQLRTEIKAAERELFHDPLHAGFRQQVTQIFSTT